MRHKYDLLAFLELETRGIVLSDYASNGYEPPIVWDFMTTSGTLSQTGYFRKGGVECAFEALFTFSRASNATVYDRDELLKWAAHNLVRYSEDFTNVLWVKDQTTVTQNAAEWVDGELTANILTDNAVSNRHRLYQLDTSTEQQVLLVFAKSGTADFVSLSEGNSASPWATFDLSDGSTYASSNCTATATYIINGWYLLKVVPDAGQPSLNHSVIGMGTTGVQAHPNGIYVGVGDTIFFNFPHNHLYGLGGMQDNPDQLDPLLGSYVPTTSAPAYQRRNSYRFKDSFWVGPKCLIESSIATNEHVNSNDFSGWTTLSLTKVVEGPRTKLIPTATSGLHYITANIFTPLAATQYTVSVISKAAGYNFCVLQFVAGGINAYKLFDVQNGALGSTGVGFDNATITEIAPNEYLCTMTVTTLSTGSGPIRYWAQDSDSISNFSGDTTSGIEIQHTQCEAGTVASSRVPTGSNTVNRAAETLEISAPNHVSVSATMTVSGVSIWNKGEINYTDNALSIEAAIVDWRIDANNVIIQALQTLGTHVGNWKSLQISTGAGDNIQTTGSPTSPGYNVFFNLASVNTPSRINVAFDGTSETENATVASLVDLSAQDISLAFSGNIELEKGALWALDIEDAGIEEATTEPYIMAGYVADGYVE